jgi:hypothetical protein
MARPYSAGDLSRAQRARHAVGPLLLVPARRGLSKHQRAYLPQMFPAPSLLFPTAITPDLGPGERVRERGLDLEALSPAFAFWKEDLIPLRLGKPDVTDSVASIWKSRWVNQSESFGP